MRICGSSSWSKVALVLILVALGFHSAGYGTNYWMARYTVRDKYHFGVGLWWVTNCSGSYEYVVKTCNYTNSEIPSNYITFLMQATRALESVTMVVLFVTSVCLGFYVLRESSRTKCMAIAVMSLISFAALTSIAGMITWIKNLPENHYPDWSMGLTVFAITMAITSTILLIPDICQYDYTNNPKVGGEFRNLSVTEADTVKEKHPEPEPVVEGETNLKPKIIPQHPMAAPSYQFVQYNKRKMHDGF